MRGLLSEDGFYRYVKETGIDDARLESVICGKECKNSGFYEICSAFAHCAIERGSYDEKKQEIVIDNLRMLIQEFCVKHNLSIDFALFKAVNQFYSQMACELEQPSSVLLIYDKCENLYSGGAKGVFLGQPVVGNVIMEKVWGECMYDFD